MKNKKLMISLFSLCLVVIVGLLTTVIVLAAGTQNVSSTIDVVYTATNISGTVSATYKVGTGSEVSFTTTGAAEGAKSITFTPDEETQTRTLTPVGQIAVDAKQREVVFKYSFTNAGGHNYTATVGYTAGEGDTTSNYAMTYSTDGTTWNDTKEVTVSAGGSANLYIKVRIVDTSKDMKLAGTFAWNLAIAG